MLFSAMCISSTLHVVLVVYTCLHMHMHVSLLFQTGLQTLVRTSLSVAYFKCMGPFQVCYDCRSNILEDIHVAVPGVPGTPQPFISVQHYTHA